MNIRPKVIIFLSIIISGCAISHKPSDLRSGTAPTEFSNAQSSKVLALCVSDEWEKIENSLMRVQLKPTSTGYSVWVEQTVGSPGGFSVQNSATFLADIQDTPSGSITRYYTLSTSKTDWKSALARCLQKSPSVTSTAPERTVLEPQVNSSTAQKLRELQSLRKDGVITEDELQSKKRQLLEKF